MGPQARLARRERGAREERRGMLPEDEQRQQAPPAELRGRTVPIATFATFMS